MTVTPLFFDTYQNPISSGFNLSILACSVIHTSGSTVNCTNTTTSYQANLTKSGIYVWTFSFSGIVIPCNYCFTKVNAGISNISNLYSMTQSYVNV